MKLPKFIGAADIEPHKKGRRLYGVFVRLYNGKQLYMAVRRHKEIYRHGRKSLSQAMREGVAGWAIDSDTLMEAERRGIDHIGVFVKDTGDKYLTERERFYDPYIAHMIDYTSKGGSIQRVLPLGSFAMRHGPVKL